MNDQKNFAGKVAAALIVGYSFAAAWVVYADIVFNNHIPIENIAFHGLYPLSIGIAAIIISLLFDRNLKSLGFSPFKISYLFIPMVIATTILLIPFALNLLAGIATIKASAKFDSELVLMGLPVILLLATGEEIMWRGVLFSTIYKKFDFIKTSVIIGLLWAIWHFPVIIHTKFMYGDRPLWFVIPAFTIMVISSSFILNFLRLKSNSIWPCIFLHAFQNYIAFVIIEPLEMTASTSSFFFKHDIGIFYILIMMLGACFCIRDVHLESEKLK